MLALLAHCTLCRSLLKDKCFQLSKLEGSLAKLCLLVQSTHSTDEKTEAVKSRVTNRYLLQHSFGYIISNLITCYDSEG